MAVSTVLAILAIPSVPDDVAKWGPVLSWISHFPANLLLPIGGFLGLAVWVAWLLRPVRNHPPGQRSEGVISDRHPELSFGNPVVGDLQPLSVPHGGSLKSLGNGRVVRLPIANAQGAADAHAAHAQLRFLDKHGKPILHSQPGRWRDHPGYEKDLLGNGKPHEIDLFVRLGNAHDKCYVWNDESLAAGVRTDAFRVDSYRFLVEVTVRAKHPGATIQETFRVVSTLHPEVVREGETSVWESAADALALVDRAGAALVEVRDHGLLVQGDGIIGVNWGCYAIWHEHAFDFLETVFGPDDRARVLSKQGRTPHTECIADDVAALDDLLTRKNEWSIRVDIAGIEEAIRRYRTFNVQSEELDDCCDDCRAAILDPPPSLPADRRYVNVTAAEKRYVRRRRRLAEKRELRGEHQRRATRARRWGWWFA